jgi:hypothetical protein
MGFVYHPSLALTVTASQDKYKDKFNSGNVTFSARTGQDFAAGFFYSYIACPDISQVYFFVIMMILPQKKNNLLGFPCHTPPHNYCFKN